MLRPCCSVVGLSTGLGAVSNRIKSNRSRVRKDPFGIVGKAATVCCADANGRPVLGVVFVVAVVLRDCVAHCEYVCVCAWAIHSFRTALRTVCAMQKLPVLCQCARAFSCVRVCMCRWLFDGRNRQYPNRVRECTTHPFIDWRRFQYRSSLVPLVLGTS